MKNIVGFIIAFCTVKLQAVELSQNCSNYYIIFKETDTASEIISLDAIDLTLLDPDIPRHCYLGLSCDVLSGSKVCSYEPGVSKSTENHTPTTTAESNDKDIPRDTSQTSSTGHDRVTDTTPKITNKTVIHTPKSNSPNHTDGLNNEHLERKNKIDCSDCLTTMLRNNSLNIMLVLLLLGIGISACNILCYIAIKQVGKCMRGKPAASEHNSDDISKRYWE